MRRAFLLLAIPTLAFGRVSAATNVTFDAGADLRIRQEIAGNVTGLPGDPTAVLSKTAKKSLNHIRFRPRVWTRAAAGPFDLYLRLADEFREHIVRNGVRRQDRSYNFPDEVVIDNLYFGGTGLFNDLLDFRVGRQDLFERGHSVVGLDRLMLDGAPYVGSRSCYADMAKMTLKPTETGRLDLFGLYDSGRNYLRWGHIHSKLRPMNAIHPGDACDRDEWGFGAVWYDELLLGRDYRLPYRFYVLNKNATHYTRFDGAAMGGSHVTTIGAWTKPRLTEILSLELDGAAQPGHISGQGASDAWLGYAALEARERWNGWVPYARTSAYYLSHRWDPMWARAPCDSELFQYGTLSGLGWWNNMLYVRETLGLEFGAHHGISVYAGPMWAAENDHAGRLGTEGGSVYKGFLSAARYDFPIILAPKGATGFKRFEAFGHVMAEWFHPGDYYESGKPAWFLRWEVTFKF